MRWWGVTQSRLSMGLGNIKDRFGVKNCLGQNRNKFGVLFGTDSGWVQGFVKDRFGTHFRQVQVFIQDMFETSLGHIQDKYMVFFGTILDKFRTGLEQVQFLFRTGLGQVWDQFRIMFRKSLRFCLEQLWDKFMTGFWTGSGFYSGQAQNKLRVWFGTSLEHVQGFVQGCGHSFVGFCLMSDNLTIYTLFEGSWSINSDRYKTGS